MSTELVESPSKGQVGANKVSDASILALGKEKEKWCSRPCLKTLFKILMYILVINGAGAFWLAYFVSNSLFWAINEDVFDFDFQAVTWASLVTCGLGTFSLILSGNALLKSPEWFFRLYSALFSGVPAAGMIFLAYGAGSQTYYLERDTDIFCEGGFSRMNKIADSYIYHFYKVE